MDAIATDLNILHGGLTCASIAGCCKDLLEVKKEKKRLSEELSDAKILLKRYVEIINSQKHELNDLNEAGAEFEVRTQMTCRST